MSKRTAIADTCQPRATKKDLSSFLVHSRSTILIEEIRTTRTLTKEAPIEMSLSEKTSRMEVLYLL